MTTMVERPLSDFWWLALLRGLVKLALGVFLIVAPGTTVTTLILLIGIFWLLSGIFSIVSIFMGYPRRHWVWALGGGVLGIIAGLLALSQPVLSTILIIAVLVIVFGILGIVKGVIGLIEALRGAGWYGVVWGGFNLITGILLLSVPLLSVQVLILILGIAAVIGGLISIWQAVQMRRG